MIRKIFAGLVVTFFFTSSTPFAWAEDHPLLTWERGIEQNIVLGGVASTSTWEIKMVRQGSPPVSFQKSSINAQGFLVYSAVLASDLPLGDYTVYIFENGATSGSVAATVSVVNLTHYSISHLPRDLALVILVLIFIIVSLSVIRGVKYSQLDMWRQKSLIEHGTLMFDKRLPRFAYAIYLLRHGALVSDRASVFKFLLRLDETFVHKISPLLWSLLPAIALFAGVDAGYLTHGNLPNIPIFFLFALSSIGLFDAFSGVFATLGFAIGQVLIGEVMSLRAVMVLASLALMWVFASVYGNLLYSSARLDFPFARQRKNSTDGDFLLLVVISVIIGVYFFAVQVLTQSLSIGISSNRETMIRLSIAMGAFFGVKIFARQQLDSSIARGQKADSLTLENYHFKNLMSPNFVAIVASSAMLTAFVWAESWAVAIVSGLLFLVLFGSLMLDSRPVNLHLFSQWRRNVLVEAGAITLVSFYLFSYVDQLPFQITQRSEIFMTLGFLLPLLHVILSSFHLASQRIKVNGESINQ